MSLVQRYVKKPHLLLSVVLLLAVVGGVGFFKLPVNLFPDSERPQISVVTVWPGASADDVSGDVSRVIEKEVKTIELVRRVTSTSNDEVSVVTAEFEYEKGLDSAATDVSNALNKIRSLLPPDIRPFQVYKVSSATPAVLVLALSPKDGSGLDLSMVRQLAQNPVKEALLRLPDVANVEVFGGYQPVVSVVLDPDKLQAYRLSPGQVVAALSAWNRNTPEGLLVTDPTHLLLKSQGEFVRPEEAGGIVIGGAPGPPVYLRDVATIRRGVQERMSAYHGNGKPAIGVSIQRALSGFALPTIEAVAAKLPELERQFPGISFEIADTQGELIGKSVSNMVDALRDAILLTVLVIFLFLADTRGMILAGISIPFTYLITFAFMWLFGFQFDMVTLTGVILGVGMLLDDAIVVLENIERHYHKLGKDLSSATIGGTEEVMLAILSGTYATVVVLLPIIYIGGFVQTVLRPLSLTLSIALLASYLVSVTILPILAPFILRLGGRTEKWGWEKKLDHVVNGTILHRIQEFFVKVVEVALRRKTLFILPAVLLLVISGRLVIPLVGRDLMPPMDTGIFRVTFEAYPNASLAEAETLLTQAEKAIRAEPGIVRTSATLGSEPGVLTFGSGRNPQQAFVTVHLVDRFHRKESLWDVERSVLARLRTIPGIRFPAAFDYGATPLSTIRSTVDLMISGPDPKTLASLSQDVARRLRTVGGLTSVVPTWTLDRVEVRFLPDAEQLSFYGVDAAAVAAQVSAQVKGTPATLFRVPQQDSFAVWVQAAGRPPRRSGGSRHAPGPHAEGQRPALVTRPARAGLRSDASHAAEPPGDGGRPGLPLDDRGHPHQRRRHQGARGPEAPTGLHPHRRRGTQDDGRGVLGADEGARPRPDPPVLLPGPGLPLVPSPAHDHGGDPARGHRSRLGAPPDRQAPVHAVVHGDDPARRDRREEQHSPHRLHRGGARARREPPRRPDGIRAREDAADPDDGRGDRGRDAPDRPRVGDRPGAPQPARRGRDRRPHGVDVPHPHLRSRLLRPVRVRTAAAEPGVRQAGAAPRPR